MWLASVCSLLAFAAVLQNCDAQKAILTPPYFNLAEGRKIYASATCGEDIEGPELYCKLIGSNADHDSQYNLIQGQYCDTCDPTKPDKRHPPEYAVDGTSSWWQSPPLSRGNKYNEVNLTIDFGQEFHVAYIFIKMGISPRPGLWILEKSTDYGKSFTPWQYFSDSAADCELFFGKESLEGIKSDDSVICSTDHSKIVPLEGGEIPIMLLNNRPSANHYFNSSVLQEWTRATNVRFRFLRTKNLLGHLMSVARQDTSVTRRYFYSIKDISIGGRCMCNGHADSCDVQNSAVPNILQCSCQHNTCGAKCERCCPGFEQKAWRISKASQPFFCEPCNCFQHSNECLYDPEIDAKRLSLDIHGNYEGGGVCKNCQHNTEGINCNKCMPTFYRPYEKHWNETDVCQPCNCDPFFSTGNCEEGSGRCECRKEFLEPHCDDCSFGYYGYPNCKACECFLNGTLELQCERENGMCTCRNNFNGTFCKECAEEFYGFPECKPCECDDLGSVSQSCNQETGYCTCKSNYGGEKCDQCHNGYFDYPSCEYCNCDVKGTIDIICNKTTGKCICKEGYGGQRCDQCIAGYYGYPDCQQCNCSTIGSPSTVCDASGKCSCLSNFAGRTCNQCSPGYYKYPECLPCNCDSHGANGMSCDTDGLCECHSNFDGNRCDRCKEGYYNFPTCEDCNCHPAGVIEGFAGCGSVPAGELCLCKDRVEGRICNKCKPLYWNLNAKNSDGCEDCNCNTNGVLGGLLVCDGDSGQCPCKPSVVARGCTECADGTFNLQQENLFGCTDCGCDIGGALSPICNKRTGECACQSRVTGRTCKQPLQTHYFPTLYQYQYEIEDGHSPQGSKVRYAYNETQFPDYSWKGYAVFSFLQREVIQDIYVAKPSVYLMVLHYVNEHETTIGTIKAIPESPTDNEQTLQVMFKNTSAPTSVITESLVMNTGPWRFIIKIDKPLLLDYFVLLPEEFYSASILKQRVENPCKIFDKGLCRDFRYPNVSSFATTWGAGAFIDLGDEMAAKPSEFFTDEEQLKELGIRKMVPIISPAQQGLDYLLSVNKAGPYVIVLTYVTPRDDDRSHSIDVDIIADVVTTGKIELYSCSYSHTCRQVVRSGAGGVSVINATDDIKIKLKGNNTNVGIESIIAIPYDEWSLDYIGPRPICIKESGECVKASFPNSPESKKVQYEQEVIVEETVPPIVAKNTTTYIHLNPKQSVIDIKGKVPIAGQYYVFVVHYYQPDYPEYDLNIIIQNGQFYKAKLPVRHCPSESGCRALIVQPKENNNKFLLYENFVITHELPDKKNRDIYLDYILVIPHDVYSPQILEEDYFDRANQFIRSCANKNFDVDTTQDGFCRDSVFSITAGYNNGALPCECDYLGSLSFECDKFGGQCKCRPHIIGRQCEACKTGYYGFPDCQRCNCPSTAVCEPESGVCICPSHVTGERCDQCEPLTYGFDPIIGCEECKCNPLGVRNHDLQCNLLSGECDCQENIVGRSCDICKAGHAYYPSCDTCNCDIRGTITDICDQDTAECLCKKYATDVDCSRCKEGSFNLQANNEEGCTECFCFGKTTRCHSSDLVKTAVSDAKNWKVVEVNTTENFEMKVLNITVDNPDSTYDLNVNFEGENVTENGTLYLSAPDTYLGKMLVAYGGFLKFRVYYTIGHSGRAISGADIILQGANTYLTYYNVEQPAVATDYEGSLEMVESNFELPLGQSAKREHIMAVLNDLRGLYIRVNYWSATDKITISDVYLEIGEESKYYPNAGNLTLATSVEHCDCPPNYQGLSCEECAPGYYRVQGPHGGSCLQCQCHGHADTCDVKTGICTNCQHNTRGDHCEMCEVGYHGNAEQGTPMDCLICACPLPIASNNFATSCNVSSDGEKISCDCIEGYLGAKCDSCGPGFYGKPEIQNETCKPCSCSGNIDASLKESCDSETGECLKCLNNTFGAACALCAPGYFGDAIDKKDCQACICDRWGTERCDSYTGTCVCKRNVIGEKCDRCEIEHYNFESGEGCDPCNCAIASESNQCDDRTGQCKCKSGVTGKTCDRCAHDFWNYTETGCSSCKCNKEYAIGVGCNPHTGQCECLTGVIGEKCDHCPHRWAFIPGYGCHQCDQCTHALLDTTDALAALIDPIIHEFDSADSGFFTSRRFIHINETFENLKPRVLALDPENTDLTPIIQELESLEQDSLNMNRKANYSLDNGEKLVQEAGAVKNATNQAKNDLNKAIDNIHDAIDTIEQLSRNLTFGEGPKTEAAKQEAEAIMDELRKHNLAQPKVRVTNATIDVGNIIIELRTFNASISPLITGVTDLEDDLKLYNDKLDDLHNHTQYTINKAREAELLYAQNSQDRIQKKFESSLNHTQEAKNNLKDSDELLQNATLNLKNAKDLYSNLSNYLDSIEVPIKDFESMNDYTEQQLFSLEDRLPKVFDHAANLSTRAEELNNILHETEGTSANAIRAANAYNDIVTAIEEAFAAAEESKEYVTNASTAREALNKKVANATDNASDLLDDVYATKQNIQKELEPKLLESQIKSRKIRSIHDKNVEKVKGIEDFIKNYPSQSVDGLLIDALETTNTADVETQDILKQIGSNYNEVPHETNAAKELPKKLHNANQGIDQVKQQLNDINEKLPELIEKLKKYPTQPSDLGAISDNLQDKIKKLNRQIALARDIANRIKVGLRFERNTTLELRNIESLPDLATSTYISGYFKTKEKNGLLLYLGNEVGTNLRRTTTDDFMALEIENGYPVLTIDLGVRAERIVNPKYVAEDIWYQFIIERTGLNAKLIIRKDRRDGTVEETVQEYVLDGPYTIFNVDRNQTKLFVGSHPPEFRIQDSIRQSSFEGEVEDLVIGDTPVSLWNFNSGFENHRGAYERDRLKNLHPSTGCRFNGEGYVLVDARTTQSINKRSDIQLRFKTFATTGLLFLYGKERTFIALEIRNGKVLYKYNLGYGIKVWSSPNTYNDGNWHLISARRDGSKSVLTIDDEPIEDVTPSVGGTTLEQADYLFFGGYPGTHHFIDVTNTDFDGCIDNVIMRNPIDLNQNVRAYGVTPGCPVKFARLVSFSKTKPRAYMEAGPVYVNNDFKMTLKFKTKEKDGLIFYATNREQSDSVSLALKNSKLILISQNIELSFNDNYNDSEWHVVSIRHNSTALRIDLDDYDFREINPDAPPKPLHITYGQLFIGGVPDEYIIKKRNAATDKSFVGCIGDATLNGTIVNFANSTNKLGDKLGKCILDERDDISSIDHTVPPLPPLHELPKVSTALPEIQTLDPYNEDLAKSGRGDGGQDAGRDSGEVEPITDAPDHDVVPPDDDFESTEATPVTSRIPYPPRTVPQPGIYEPTCALPLHPVMTEINEVYGPFKFGSAPESRIEYEQPRGKYKKQYEFMVEFKTQATNGLIFYASNPDNSHYVALYMQDGHLIHKFDGGTGPAFMKTDLTYNDDQWHKVVFTRNNSVGSLKVDGDSFSSNTSQPTIRVDIGAPFMLGGFSPEKRSFITDTTNIEDNFQGCLKNFGMNSKPMEKPVSHAIESCTDGTEEGTFFQGGYISLKNKFKVGLEMEIKMDIKPRNVTGLLVAVHGRKDFLVLEMVNGVLRFTVENGRGPITTSFEPDSRHYLCDGKWHSIQAVKSKSVVTLSVDKTFTEPGIGDHRASSTDTGGVLFLGSHRLLTKARGIVTRKPFYGCMRNVAINNQPATILQNMKTGDVTIGSCPMN